MEITEFQERTAYELGGCFCYMDIYLSEYTAEYELSPDYLSPYELFRCFQHKATVLGIKVQDLPEDAPWNSETKQFIRNQIDLVITSINKSSRRILSLFEAGTYVATVTRVATCVIEGKTEKEELDRQATIWQDTIKHLLKIAENLEADTTTLQADFDHMRENWFTMTKPQLNEIQERIKNAFCSQKKIEKYSEVDHNRPITTDHWVVSLVRLPDLNDKHAFLVLEGTDGKKSMIWFADFVAKKLSDTLLPGTKDGKVRLGYYESTQFQNCKLLFNCDKPLMEISRSDRLASETWSISQTKARKLIHKIEDHQKEPPKYNLLGDASALAWSSAKSSSNKTGHNCQTFARRVLKDLEDDRIEIPKEPLEKWIDPLIIAFGVAVVVAFLLGKMF